MTVLFLWGEGECIFWDSTTGIFILLNLGFPLYYTRLLFRPATRHCGYYPSIRSILFLSGFQQSILLDCSRSYLPFGRIGHIFTSLVVVMMVLFLWGGCLFWLAVISLVVCFLPDGCPLPVDPPDVNNQSIWSIGLHIPIVFIGYRLQD